MPRSDPTARLSLGADDAKAWAERLPEGAIKARAVDSIAEFIAERSPQTAASWVAQFSGSESGIAWIESIDGADLRDETLVTQGRSWLQRDPEAAGAWLDRAEIPESVLERIRAE